MTKISDLIKILPDIILYLVVGFCFIQVFRTTYTFDISKDSWTSMLVIGFVIVKCANVIPVSISKSIDNICIVITAIILAYLLGRFLNSFHAQNILDKLKIRKTLNENIWNDLIDLVYPMKAEININGHFYQGDIHLIEEGKSTPLIVLANYTIDDKKEKQNKVMVINTDKIDHMVIIYDKDSPYYRDLPNRQ